MPKNSTRKRKRQFQGNRFKKLANKSTQEPFVLNESSRANKLQESLNGSLSAMDNLDIVYNRPSRNVTSFVTF